MPKHWATGPASASWPFSPCSSMVGGGMTELVTISYCTARRGAVPRCQLEVREGRASTRECRMHRCSATRMMLRYLLTAELEGIGVCVPPSFLNGNSRS